jgi:4-hydroxy-3-methylbut-2-en-1-yl diphosphate reductase
MMTAVRSDAATRARLFRIIVVMGWFTHAADVAGGLDCAEPADLVDRPGHRARSWVFASPPGLVLSCATFADPDPNSPLPRKDARQTHPGKVGSARRAQEDRATRSEADGDHPSPADRHTATRALAWPRAGHGYDGSMGTVLLAAPRGYCAGVERAVDAVERALEQHGGPVYVRKQIVHNLHVVRDLELKGAVFVDELDEVPEAAVAVLSAHGSSPTVHLDAASRQLGLIDATCPLVTKVHLEARRFAEDDRTIILIGHAGHEEVEGTSGQAPDRTILVQSIEEAERVEVPDPARLSYLTQTTLSVDETNQIVEALRSRFPGIQGPPREDICYATQNRQDAVKEVARRADVVLVIGSKNSSNSNRLAEVSLEWGTPAYLVDDESEVDSAWLDGADVVGLTSGASAPERLVTRMLGWLAARGFDRVEQALITEERVRFTLPPGVRATTKS